MPTLRKAPKPDPEQMYRAIDGFIYRSKSGLDDFVREDERLLGSHEAVQARPELFMPDGLDDVTCPHRGPPPHSPKGGSADSKVVVSRPDGVDAHWTLGRPCEWEGEWDLATI